MPSPSGFIACGGVARGMRTCGETAVHATLPRCPPRTENVRRLYSTGSECCERVKVGVGGVGEGAGGRTVSPSP